MKVKIAIASLIVGLLVPSLASARIRPMPGPTTYLVTYSQYGRAI